MATQRRTATRKTAAKAEEPKVEEQDVVTKEEEPTTNDDDKTDEEQPEEEPKVKEPEAPEIPEGLTEEIPPHVTEEENDGLVAIHAVNIEDNTALARLLLAAGDGVEVRTAPKRFLVSKEHAKKAGLA